jgi:hypothetical protein
LRFAGASVANTTPFRVMVTISPPSIHFATSAKWFRRSRTVAVFIVMRLKEHPGPWLPVVALAPMAQVSAGLKPRIKPVSSIET